MDSFSLLSTATATVSVVLRLLHGSCRFYRLGTPYFESNTRIWFDPSKKPEVQSTSGFRVRRMRIRSRKS